LDEHQKIHAQFKKKSCTRLDYRLS
jgi:hypothetical protein